MVIYQFLKEPVDILKKEHLLFALVSILPLTIMLFALVAVLVKWDVTAQTMRGAR